LKSLLFDKPYCETAYILKKPLPQKVTIQETVDWIELRSPLFYKAINRNKEDNFLKIQYIREQLHVKAVSLIKHNLKSEYLEKTLFEILTLL
jgi:hypothetical protein